MSLGTELKSQLDELPALIRQCGVPGFSTALMAFLQRQARVDHLSIFIFDQNLVPRLVAAEGIGQSNLAKKAGKEYELSDLYQHDPNTTRVKTDEEGYCGPVLMRLKAEEISDGPYREKIYRRFNLVDRLSIIDQMNERWLVINLYRNRESGEFSGEDVATIERLADLISALLEKNFALLPPSVWQSTTRPSVDMLESIISGLNAALSRREVEVCARALQGMTNTGIGLDLGIQEPTVSTLRKRAYAKLNISSLNELFSLCLGKTVTRDNAL